MIHVMLFQKRTVYSFNRKILLPDSAEINYYPEGVFDIAYNSSEFYPRMNLDDRVSCQIWIHFRSYLPTLTNYSVSCHWRTQLIDILIKNA